MAPLVLRRAARRSLRTISRPVHTIIGSIEKVQTDSPLAALTFDDGPDEHHTARILEVLARHAVTATFFVLAQRAARLPEIVEAIKSGGHEIALHGDDHSPLINCSTRQKVAKIRGGKARLEAAVDGPVRYFRPPYGWQDGRSFLVARLLGLDVVTWSVEVGDCRDPDPAHVAERAASMLEPGAILLLHDHCEGLPGRTPHPDGARLDRATMIEDLLGRAAARRLELVSLGALLREGTPVRQPAFWRPDLSV